MHSNSATLLIQEGEFIDVFLLPYDGLYTALLVSVVSSAATPCQWQQPLNR